ncbi:hypothetical protein RE438_27930 (plasmid) [Bacillus wiedmannii]|uniref:hypothetical protein n=1 Tax=Bacillus wiedmannii TaxID=1890302 RepID=UPI00065B9F2A|nr:hypothetical protein [Bacillus wiedmannii]KMP78202.1 hypothetical protein TU62_02085 [Bacillus cereus]MCQ6546372.1 hypothetical protein [Bacillus wiedmannii]MCQ6575197.1 hypothetical protein [Bacillus wiedmannii]WMS85082.1 hypothetical protein RE438_27930 [Bacillus wiedmannii]
MKRRIGTAVVGLSVLGFGIFGFTHGNGGEVVQAASEGDGGGAPAYAHGDHGGAPSYTHGHFPAPKLESDGHTGGAPSYNKGDTWSQSYAHGNTGAPANTEPGGGI